MSVANKDCGETKNGSQLSVLLYFNENFSGADQSHLSEASEVPAKLKYHIGGVHTTSTFSFMELTGLL